MVETVIWALLTGGITGGTWVAIVLLQRQRRLAEAQARFEEEQPAFRADVERRIGEVERLELRLAEVEERLDFAERLLTQQRDAERLPPASGA